MNSSKVAKAIAAGAFAAAALALGVVPAQAGADVRGQECGWGGCSEIQNRSHRDVKVGRDWCGDDPAGTVKKVKWICGKPSDKHPYQDLKPGEHSHESAYADTDTFRIDPGYEMHVQWNNDGEENGPVTVYGKKDHTRWVKVANNHDIDIEAYFKP
ncbi:hypothetical protein LZ318_24375 [Saccharopolyspora indica]|uniref:hypothetical protein n=1 Tax=Saccharopolyspora indica TaxID=1229659 RepID=UPI0022EB96C6|nr:hypothetical protein [Saccharopolyspora indica]MDA3644772.1 hypothetical protein [Saccharopolyspora indica]